MNRIKRLIKDILNISFYVKRIDIKNFFVYFLRHPVITRRLILYSDASFKTIENKTIVSLNNPLGGGGGCLFISIVFAI